jgi:hypothetical protein
VARHEQDSSAGFGHPVPEKKPVRAIKCFTPKPPVQAIKKEQSCPK